MIELGGTIVGSFSFYLFGSPFFWLTMLFPESWIPYILPFVMALRYGTATLTSFVWIRQFTKTDRAALIGAFLYAFSGFQAINIVFSHFHDVTAFFPLYLYAFDKMMQNNKRVPFIIMTAFMAILNYYFFFGEVVFLVIYFFVRYFRKRNKKKNVKLFFTALTSGTIGLGLSSFYLIQALNGLIGNNRLGSIINGNSLIAYNSSLTIWSIIKSAFFVPELMGRQ